MLEKNIEALRIEITSLNNRIDSITSFLNDTLLKQYEGLTAAIEKLTNTLTPPPVAAAAQPKKLKKKQTKQPEPLEDQPKPEKDNPTLEDVRSSLKELSVEHGKEAARNILADFDAVKVTDLKATDYAQLIAVVNKFKAEAA